MTRRKGDPVHGWLNLDKPVGISSARAVARVKALLNAQKAGHGGTLDPLASGILPIALGEATKTVSWAMAGTKVYEFTVNFGESRDTDDGEGAVTGTSAVRPDAAAIEAVLGEFTGDVCQVPPAFSALKVSGRRAYELARAGEIPVLAPRNVRIDRLRLLGGGGAEARLEVTCGKGTYVRSLVRDLAIRLGTLGYVHRLRRIRCGPFSQETAISLDKLNELSHSARHAEALLPVEVALDDIPALALTQEDALRLQCGQQVEAPATVEGMVYVTADGQLIALADATHGQLRPVRVFSF